MQIKVTVATALLAITAANAAPVDMQERGWASALTKVIGTTPNEKLNTGLAAGGVGMMGYNTFGAQKREPKGGKLFGDTANSKLQTGLAAGGVGIMGTGLLESQFGSQKRAVEPTESTSTSSASTEGKSGGGSIFGDSANSKLNTGLAAAGTGMMGYNLYNTMNQQQQQQQRRAVEPVTGGRSSTSSSTAATEGKSNNIFGDTSNSKLNTGLAAAGTGMMAYNLYNSMNQQNQKRHILQGDGDDDYVIFYTREAPIAPIVEGIAEAAGSGGEAAMGGEAAASGGSTLSKVGDAAGLASGLGGGSSSSGSSGGSSGSNAVNSGAVAKAKGQA